jgi:hypothetical protein
MKVEEGLLGTMKETRGVGILVDNRGDKYDQGTLYTCMKMSSFNQLFYTFNTQ